MAKGEIQVSINVDESKPAREANLPVIRIPGFPGLVPGSSASLGVHDHSSCSSQQKGGACIIAWNYSGPLFRTLGFFLPHGREFELFSSDGLAMLMLELQIPFSRVIENVASHRLLLLWA